MRARTIVMALLLSVSVAPLALVLVSCRDAAPPMASVEYFCVMHPQIVQDHPGSCPICQMKLEKRDKAPAHEHAAPRPSLDGRVPVTLSPEQRGRLGIRTAIVAPAAVSGELRTIGRITVDERRVHHVHTKFEGYVERLHVDFMGRLVRRGEPLLSIYSPDLLATQNEYLIAYRSGRPELLESARRRLLLWDISPEDIQQLEERGAAQRTLELHAPMTGYVIAKTAVHGMRVTPMDTLFSLADLSHVWALADVYEHDLGRVRQGATAEVRTRHLPDRVWRGTVTFVAPTVDEATRTVKVRVEVANADAELKPEMFVDVNLRYDEGTRLTIPADAVIETGRRQIVFVDREDGTLEPREVSVGPRSGALVPVASGLSAGERVVLGASFLVDSESSLKGAVNAAAATSPHAGH